MNKGITTFILIYSELIWLYFIIAFFTMAERDEPFFINVLFWIVAPLAGYVIQRLFAGKISFLNLIIVNIVAIILIVILNWRFYLTDAATLYAVTISVVLTLSYYRSGQFALIDQTRLHMLHRFEVNVLCYVLLALVFKENVIFHASFLAAIFLSLMGMVMTLEKHGDGDGRTEVEVKKVGSAGWFSGVIGLVVAAVTLISFFMFLPSIREGIRTLGEGGWTGLKWLGNSFIAILLWISKFFLERDYEQILETGVEGSGPNEADFEEVLFTLPSEWLIYLAIFVGISLMFVIIWYLSKFLKQYRPQVAPTENRQFLFEGSLWKNLMRSIRDFFRKINRKWRMKFSIYYKEKVYWYFYQIELWGEKNGIGRKKSETTKEYVERIIAVSQNHKSEIGEVDVDELAGILRKINEAFQAAYYGQQKTFNEEDYKSGLQRLKQIKLTKKSSPKQFEHVVETSEI